MSQAEAPTTSQQKKTLGLEIQELVLRLRAYIALIILVIIFSILSPVFLTANSIIIMIDHIAINAIMAIGMTFVIVAAGIDLSVGSIAGLTAMIAGGMIDEGVVLRPLGVIVYFHTWSIILIALLIGIVIGAINGVVITRFNVAPFIATLGMLYVGRGFALLRSGGNTFPNLVGNPAYGNTGFPLLGDGTVLSIPYPIWIMVIFALAAGFVASRTPFGRRVYAVGGNQRAARYAGVPVKRVTLLVYVISGFCAAMAGLIIASELQAAQPSIGTSYELNAIAATVLGGTSLFGGKGTIGGAIIGLMFAAIFRLTRNIFILWPVFQPAGQLITLLKDGLDLPMIASLGFVEVLLGMGALIWLAGRYGKKARAGGAKASIIPGLKGSSL
jgi:erythritol transport system permease protein